MAANRESMPFTMGLHQAPPPQQPPQSQNMQLTFGADGTALYKPIQSPLPPPQYQTNSGGNGSAANPSLNMNMPVTMIGSEPVKRKRGRPRKYGPESEGMSLGLVPGAPSFTISQPNDGGGGGGGDGGGSSPTLKKTRGRPPGSSKKHKLQALGIYITHSSIYWNLLTQSSNSRAGIGKFLFLGSSLSAEIN